MRGAMTISQGTSSMVRVSGFATGGSSRSALAVSGNYVYQPSHNGDGCDAFRVIDVSNPISPSLVGATCVRRAKYSHSIVLSGNYAYVGYDVPDTVIAWDISNPTLPKELGGIQIEATGVGGSNLSIATDGRYVYAVAEADPAKVVVLDFANPNAPKQVGSVILNSGESEGRIAVSGRYAYIATNNSPAKIVAVDISNPSSPLRKGAVTLNTGENIAGIAVSGRYAYVITMTDPMRFVVVDISNPSSSQRIYI